jgi:hypothetical protein
MESPMERLIVSLESEEKRWLHQRSREEGVSMGEVIRRAVRKLRESEDAGAKGQTFEELLRSTAGIWAGGDGLEHQRQLRAEWSD